MGVNGILLLDKDEGWTSQDCVSKLRGILGERRIGHAGTLDPLATGLLVVLVGRATRAAAFAEAETKEYIAAVPARHRYRYPGYYRQPSALVGRLHPRKRMSAPLFPGSPARSSRSRRCTAPLKSTVGSSTTSPAAAGGGARGKAHNHSFHRLSRAGKRRSHAPYPLLEGHLHPHALPRSRRVSRLRRVHGGAAAHALRELSVENARRIGALTRADRDTLLPADTLFSAAASLTLTAAQEKALPLRKSVPDRRAGRRDALLFRKRRIPRHRARRERRGRYGKKVFFEV